MVILFGQSLSRRLHGKGHFPPGERDTRSAQTPPVETAQRLKRLISQHGGYSIIRFKFVRLVSIIYLVYLWGLSMLFVGVPDESSGSRGKLFIYHGANLVVYVSIPPQSVHFTH